MNVLQETTIETIKHLPENCSAEDIMYQVNFIAQVFEGLQDAKSGRLITSEELLERVEQWAK